MSALRKKGHLQASLSIGRTMISTARHVLRITAGRRHGARSVLTTAIANQCTSYVMCKTMHTEVEVDAAKTSFFDTFDSNSSMRGVSYKIDN